MGRKQETQPLVPVEVVRECFAVRDDGVLVRLSTGEAATFPFKGKLLVRVYHQGGIRRFAAGRIAWAIAVGEWPKGVVKARNGVDDDLRLENLILTKRGPRPFDQARGGKRSSLESRSQTSTTLINALADHPGATVPQLSRLVGSSAPCVCTRLGKLADMGLTCGPKCDARARWDLTAQGRAIAASALPLIDDLDKRILAACVRSPSRALALKLQVGVCFLTIRRRVAILIERQLVKNGDGRYTATDAGRAALGDQMPSPWIRSEAISAAAASDVQRRIQFPNEMSATERTRISSLNASKARANAKRNGNAAFNSLDMTG